MREPDTDGNAGSQRYTGTERDGHCGKRNAAAYYCAELYDAESRASSRYPWTPRSRRWSVLTLRYPARTSSWALTWT